MTTSQQFFKTSENLYKFIFLYLIKFIFYYIIVYVVQYNSQILIEILSKNNTFVSSSLYLRLIFIYLFALN